MVEVGLTMPVGFMPETKWVRDLQYFDGPLLTQHENALGEHYLFQWCDQDERATRWLVMRVRERDVLQLLARKIGLRELIGKFLPDDYLRVLDFDTSGTLVRLAFVEPSALPVDYLPEGEGYLVPSLVTPSLRAGFVGLLDGDWNTQELAELYRRVRDTHALIYLHSEDTKTKFRPAPFKGGFSTINFYQQIKGYIPAKARVSERAIHYSSPGFVAFRGDVVTLGLLRDVLNTVRENEDALGEENRALSRFLRDEGLNEEDASATAEQETEMAKHAAAMLALIGRPDWEWLKSKSPSIWQATKIVRAHYRRLKDLLRFEEQGRCVLAVTGAPVKERPEQSGGDSPAPNSDPTGDRT